MRSRLMVKLCGEEGSTTDFDKRIAEIWRAVPLSLRERGLFIVD
ncbi:MAG: hypothetical protein SOX17_04455 [Prevotella sp.]|nr:hypothetical protein [Prevotella sp.]